ncbi:MAG: type I DNA topoisomerase [Prevotellaceae bacterium]|nr:type I DNA topoisomerase [Prevotellaceae bacterium]
MKENLVIVESPAKAKTIEKFLGADYKVMSSYGHIRDLKKKSFSIDTDTFEPEYEIPEDKQKLVGELRKTAESAKTVWLASDEDREGEAISWHLKEVLGLDDKNTKRIVFHEITKPAILAAIEHPRDIDKNLVNAQQARRVLDRIVGFKLSPILWRKVRPSLSAGRVQSVAVRLIVEREREVQNFKGEDYFRLTALLSDAGGNTVKAELNHKFASEQEAMDFLETCVKSDFKVVDVQSKPVSRCPAPPFTTSTLQQEAAHKLHFTVAQTMNIAQRLYESGHITYMRTDSTNLSSLCLTTSKQFITEQMGPEYSKPRQYHTKTKGAQEAHEAIRPTYISATSIEGTAQERRLYELIWRRTIACQMADALLERTTLTIGVSQSEHNFVAGGEVVKFDGFLRVYKETSEEDAPETETVTSELPPLNVGQALEPQEIVATQRFAQRPPRYNEASLVRKLEELGIGRPSTYATTITTIQQREYVMKADNPGKSVPYTLLTLKDGKIKRGEKKITIGAERGKLVPTDTGIVVNDFLTQYFPDVLDYNFTADVEKSFDQIAEGQLEWNTMIRKFYDDFNPALEKALNTRSEHRVGERMLGTDPQTGNPVSAKIGRYGPIVQIGKAGDGEKPRFAQLKKSQSLETITLEEALDLFRLPRNLGEYEGESVTVDAGRFGPYVRFRGKYISLPKELDPLEVTLQQATELIEQKRKAEEERHLRAFPEEPELEVLNGRYGPYICYKGANYRLSKPLRERARDLSLAECMEVINNAGSQKTETTNKHRYTRKS